MREFNKNNLISSSSPYLQQHVSNPVWWQEWNTEILDHALMENKPLFVSIGYSTCHWCHVMAAEAFSDKATADYLNKYFVCIKVDREQRPEIDQFMMRFLTAQSGSGGWPLNVFLTPEAQPIFALTYAPPVNNGNMRSLLSIAKKVHDYYYDKADEIHPFIEKEDPPQAADEELIIKNIASFFDNINGGFGEGQKFPPHSTLLYLLYSLCVENNAEARYICVKTLDAMRLRGLNDHLQGGIFRYCTDPEWTIPHFEKMLYDQALAIWYYSMAYKVIGKDEYRVMAENIIRCLDQCFEENGLFISAHDADTKHLEGLTYVWSYEQLEKELQPDEFRIISDSYEIDKFGNFNGNIHLIRKNDDSLSDIENKLLRIRKLREQPERDNKIICGMNALVAVSLIQAGRNLGKPYYEEKASQIIHRLINLFWNGKTLGHSYYNGSIQEQSFLFDAAAMLLAVSMLYENDKSWDIYMNTVSEYVRSFKEDEKWIESRPEDFQTVYASWFDNPIPSSISLAEMGLIRAALLTGKEIMPMPYRQPLQADFFNTANMINNGLFHVITAVEKVPWEKLMPNSVQKRGEFESDCYRGTCGKFFIK